MREGGWRVRRALRSRRSRVLAGAVVALVLAAIAWTWLDDERGLVRGTGPQTFTVLLSVDGDASFETIDNVECTGAGVFEDVRERSVLRVTDSRGISPSEARLGRGIWDEADSCEFHAVVEGLAQAESYEFRVGEHAVRIKRGEVRRSPVIPGLQGSHSVVDGSRVVLRFGSE